MDKVNGLIRLSASDLVNHPACPHLTGFHCLLRDKCAVRDVGFTGPEDFSHAPIIANVERIWDQSLGLLVPALPPFETVLEELRPQVEALVTSR